LLRARRLRDPRCSMEDYERRWLIRAGEQTGGGAARPATGRDRCIPPDMASTLTRPSAVVFDMDGLLVDSERTTREIWQASSADCGFTLTDELYLTLIGLSADEAELAVASHFGEGFVAPAFRERRVTRMRGLLESGGVAFKPGAREILAWVVSQGIPVALATASGHEEVRERLGDLVGVFATITTRTAETRGKPNPDIYLAAAASLGLPPSECLALEDSFAGVRAAAAAGMPVVMVPDLAQPTPEIADLTVGVFTSLLEARDALAAAWGVA
jgi:HAD superfamily hydrolase (TIGR01509 family)